jgi:hypothetical protein
MKRIMLLMVGLMLIFTVGCAGMNASVPVNIATDVAFVMVLQNNPSYKAPVIAGLQTIKTYLSGRVTYDDLILFISKQFGGKYAYVGVILSGYLGTDKPIFETYLPMLDSYKVAIIAKIDRLILLAGM